MTYDAARQRVVLFGGSNGTANAFADTWEWDGTTWLQLNLASPVPDRSLFAMAYDSSRQRVVLFGGLSDYFLTGLADDTLEWDGTTWAPRLPVTSPTPGPATMAYDEARQRMTLVTGGDTWVLLP
jgi:hypothetical protein